LTDTIIVIPKQITAGDSLAFVITLDDYPASDSWVLSYVLLNSAAKITLTSSADGDNHSVDIAATTTAAYTVGKYKYTALVTDGTDRFTVASGDIEVLSDPGVVATLDGRTFAEICLDNIETVLQGKATADNLAYSIAGRSLSKYSWEELLVARNSLRSEVATESRKANGKSSGNRILTRFV